MKIPALVLMVLLSALRVSAQDAIDLGSVVFHNTPEQIKLWPATKQITQIELKDGTAQQGDTVGVRPTLTPYNSQTHRDSWPEALVFPPAGYIRYTLMLFVKCLDARWHGAAVIEYYPDRVWTGDLLGNYNNWTPLGDGATACEPRQGDLIGFMAVAGDHRQNKGFYTVQERSNIVTVALVPNAVYNFDGTVPQPTPTPVPVPQPTPQPTPQPPSADLGTLREQVAALERAVADLNNAVDNLSSSQQSLRDRAGELSNRIQVLETKPLEFECSGSANLMFFRAPIRCDVRVK